MDNQTKADLLFLAKRQKALEDACIELNHAISEWTEFVNVSFLSHFSEPEHASNLRPHAKKTYIEALRSYYQAIVDLSDDFQGLLANYSQTLKRLTTLEDKVSSYTDKKTEAYTIE